MHCYVQVIGVGAGRNGKRFSHGKRVEDSGSRVSGRFIIVAVAIGSDPTLTFSSEEKAVTQ